MNPESQAAIDAQADPARAARPWILRRAQPDDAPAFARMMADPEVYGQLMQLPYPDPEGWRQRLQEQVGKPDLHLAAVVEGEVIGSAGLRAASPALRRRHALALGLSVARPWHGRGVGSDLMQALCDYADNWLGIVRLELTVYADNARALALYRKFGFEVEGCLRAYAMRDGQLTDALTMARLHPRPPAWSATGAAPASRATLAGRPTLE